MSKSWVAELVARYREGGYEAVATKSKAAKKVANRTRDEVEDTIVRLRKELTEKSFDAGAQTIHYHLSLSSPAPPSTLTIWRVLKRRGFVPPTAAQAAKKLLGALRGRAAQRNVAGRRHLLQPRRRIKGRDPQFLGRLLEGMRGI